MSSTAQARKWDTSNDGPVGNEVFLKLKPLRPDQVEKGFYKQLEVGESIEGTLTKVTTESEGKYKGKNSYHVQSFDSDTVYVITGQGNLNYRIKEKGIQPGDGVQITYLGTNIAKNGEYAGVAMHNFKVLGEA